MVKVCGVGLGCFSDMICGIGEWKCGTLALWVTLWSVLCGITCVIMVYVGDKYVGKVLYGRVTV